jgi:hypothetical protein
MATDIESWNPSRPIQWGLLTDAELVNFGAVDSVRASTSAIIAHMSRRAGGREHALAIAHESVIGPESADGVVYLDALLPYYERVAFGLGSEPASVGDQAACVLAILTRGRHGENAPTPELLDRTQRRLSELVLAHPVLLHPRLVLPVRIRNAAVKHMSLFTAMVFSGSAQLPSSRHGIDAERLVKFAKSSLVMAPIVRATPRRALVLGIGPRQQVLLEYHGVTLSTAVGITGNLHAELLASFLELARLRGKDDLWPGNPKRVHADGNVLSSILAAIPRAIGVNVSVQSKAGSSVVRWRSCQQFLDELVLSGLLNDVLGPSGQMVNSPVVERLPLAIQRTVLHSDGNAPSLAPASAMPAWLAQENTALQLTLLQKVGLAEGAAEAAKWLHHNLIAGGNAGTRALPHASLDQAFGFLSALAAAGMTVPEAPPTNLDEKGNFKGLVSVHDAWSTAHGVVSRKQAMERVLNANAAARETAETAAPAKRRGVRV